MTRHPGTEGNSLEPKRVDAIEDVTVPNEDGSRISLKNIESADISEDDVNDIAMFWSLIL